MSIPQGHVVPCPKCGGRDIEIQHDYDERFNAMWCCARCVACGRSAVWTNDRKDGDARALKLWNWDASQERVKRMCESPRRMVLDTGRLAKRVRRLRSAL